MLAAEFLHTARPAKTTWGRKMNQAVDLDELTLFRDMARRAFEQEITPHYEQWEENRMVPRELWNRLGEAGLLCPDMEEQYGGAGASPQVPSP